MACLVSLLDTEKPRSTPYLLCQTTQKLVPIHQTLVPIHKHRVKAKYIYAPLFGEKKVRTFLLCQKHIGEAISYIDFELSRIQHDFTICWARVGKSQAQIPPVPQNSLGDFTPVSVSWPTQWEEILNLFWGVWKYGGKWFFGSTKVAPSICFYKLHSNFSFVLMYRYVLHCYIDILSGNNSKR